MPIHTNVAGSHLYKVSATEPQATDSPTKGKFMNPLVFQVELIRTSVFDI